MPPTSDLADACRELVRQLLDDPHGVAPQGSAIPQHAGVTLEDHVLTTSALVACLADGHAQRDLLRLVALVHDLPDWEERLKSHAAAAKDWARVLRDHGAQLDRGEPPDLPADGVGRTLALAHLAASRRLPMHEKDAFERHPLASAGQVDLVYGGATRVKQYVFESARLPEIRGASALLDHINRLDLPALWGLPPQRPPQQPRYHETRAWFAAKFGAAPLDAPECVLYASGGNILALAPAGQGQRLAAAIERRYTEQTQVAASVAVADMFSLLELQYGRNPSAFWRDDLETLIATPATRRLLVTSYGLDLDALLDPAAAGEPQAFHRWLAGDGALAEIHQAALLAWIFGRDSLTELETQHLKPDRPPGARKGFGELVTFLASKADRRRAGDGAGTGAPHFQPFVDLLSAAPRCSSCDVRPAVRLFREPVEQHLCEACRRKRAAGIWAKKGLPKRRSTPAQSQPEARDPIVPEYAWMPSWGDWLEWQARVPVQATVDDLRELGEFARGAARGFVGLIYADGNNVGAHVAGLSSIAAYRRFARQMLEANEHAVAQSLREHLAAGQDGTWPFEIITIGGDDVLLFVPADRAPAIAATIAREFGKQMERHGTRITLSAGVLLMADHTPVRFARDLVEALLKSAKQRSKDGDGGATIDFMALKAATMVSETIKDYRRAAFQRVRRRERAGQARETRLHLTQRPYRLDDFEQLLRAGRELERARFPPSQLHQLAEIVGEGQQLRSSIDYHYFVGRGRQRSRDHAANPYTTFEQAIGQLCESGDSAPWRKTKDEQTRLEFDTPLLDLVELLPFVGPAAEERHE
jgi:CRISPR-associated protein Cmr2